MPTTTISRCGGSGVFSYDQLILALGVDAFYKLDETSGSTAHDSSGNGHDITSTTTDPTWAQVVSPAGTVAPLFAANQSIGGTGASSTYSPNLAGDFTACGWIYSTGDFGGAFDYAVRQGDTPTVGGRGWSVFHGHPAAYPSRNSGVHIGDGIGGAHEILSNSGLANGAWWHLCVVHSGTTWTQYVQGVAQTATFGGTYSSSVTPLTLAGGSNGSFYLSYVLLYARALPATAIADLAGI